jgi:hypothetical protein
MTSLVSNTQSPLVAEPLIHHLMEKMADVPRLTISDLMGEILHLLGQSAIATHAEAQSLLENRLQQIHYRNGLEPFGRNEQAFYNYSQHLIDKTTGKVSEYCLKFLRTINLKETIEVDQTFDDYHSVLNRNKAFEKELQVMREKVEALEQKLNKPSTMTPVSNIEIPSSSGTYKIPDTIPEHATHVLLYVMIYKEVDCLGRVKSHGESVSFSNTLENGYSVCFSEMTSQYIWMEICPAREIKINNSYYNRFHDSPWRNSNPVRIYLAGYK